MIHLVFFFRPSERTAEDLDVIYGKLKELKVLEKFHPLLLQQLCYYGYYESLEKGVTRECIKKSCFLNFFRVKR